MTNEQIHRGFNRAKRPHVLLINNHGCHAPQIEVTTDTGGQNFYVNHEAYALVGQGYKVTILNRGGYPHPETGQTLKGETYYERQWGPCGRFCRVMYLEDGNPAFVAKEDMDNAGLDAETAYFYRRARQLGFSCNDLYFINSHYWDGAALGMRIHRRIKAGSRQRIPHVWTPHSLGILKRKNHRNADPATVRKLKFPQRIRAEEEIIAGVNGVVSTSNAIRNTLLEYRAKVRNHLWMTPGVEVNHFKPRKITSCRSTIRLLAELTGQTQVDVTNMFRSKVVFLEISRTAKTKKKDLILKAFADIATPAGAVLIMNVDPASPLTRSLHRIREQMPNRSNVIFVDRFLSDLQVRQLFALANVYVTASVMEGWGMSVQQAAAARCAVISSKHVPYVSESLKDALVVMKNVSRLYTEKMDILMNEPNFRTFLANRSFVRSKEDSWDNVTRLMIEGMLKRKMMDAV